MLAGFGGGPPAADLWLLVGTLFVTFSLQFFSNFAGALALLRLSPGAINRGFLWQLVTYPFVGVGPASIWILLELLVLFWFARDVLGILGRTRFWTHLIVIGAIAGVLAAATNLLCASAGLASPYDLAMLQGQRRVMAVMVAAFATLRREATILLFFVLPVQAKYFLGLSLLFAFIGYLGTKDLPGFVGLVAAMLLSWQLVRSGSFGRSVRELRLRTERLLIEWKLKAMRRRRRLRLVKPGREGDQDRPPWVN